MLKFIGIDVNSFAIAGALVIFIIALEMILGIEIHKVENVKAASIVPIAFPLVAGAGNIDDYLITSCRISCSEYYFQGFCSIPFWFTSF